MSNIVIKVENVSKQYRLGKIGTGSFSHDLNRWWHTIRGMEDPYLKIGEENDRTKKTTSEYVWALRDITFDVKQGEVLGIIGRNGAGKSTILKILSRTTLPTTGNIKVKGKIASLLEVGTGFHPELTGRENIFLNGAILGMTKREVKRKFDEIVDFSGVERYIDTPVKRYSSGMYVRLAFAVAAHLEPELLIVDEVLAVGDAEFQKKCLGKMEDVSKNQGKTILFVTHSMSAINSLCNKGMVLSNGTLQFHGDVQKAVSLYLKQAPDNFGKVVLNETKGLERYGDKRYAEIISIATVNDKNDVVDTFEFGKKFKISLILKIKKEVKNPEIGVCISSGKGSRLHHLVSKWEREFGTLNLGTYKVDVELSNLSVYPGEYLLTTWFRNHVKEKTDDFIEAPLSFKVIKSSTGDVFQEFTDFSSSGGVYTKSSWDISQSYDN